MTGSGDARVSAQVRAGLRGVPRRRRTSVVRGQGWPTKFTVTVAGRADGLDGAGTNETVPLP
ncbi:hypothetical protein GCM10009530_71270 [Microbispora corallina]|uniref:Uncharacterized protein n=1 Tax=Microbispora corallina TaxID=83302 RepID=A0ABQ4GAH3_9ACTN|nr:hypothetical protein Mco01_70040 [Microbispora corallina]